MEWPCCLNFKKADVIGSKWEMIIRMFSLLWCFQRDKTSHVLRLLATHAIHTEIGANADPIVQMRKLRHREIKLFTQENEGN